MNSLQCRAFRPMTLVPPRAPGYTRLSSVPFVSGLSRCRCKSFWSMAILPLRSDCPEVLGEHLGQILRSSALDSSIGLASSIIFLRWLAGEFLPEVSGSIGAFFVEPQDMSF